MATQRTRSGVLMVRAWLEDRTADGFRVRVLGRPDIEHPDKVYERVVATPDQACSAVCAWLEAFASGPEDIAAGRGKRRAALPRTRQADRGIADVAVGALNAGGEALMRTGGLAEVNHAVAPRELERELIALRRLLLDLLGRALPAPDVVDLVNLDPTALQVALSSLLARPTSTEGDLHGNA